MTRRLSAIMFTDMAGFTSSAQADEKRTLHRLHEQEALLRPLFEPYGGREIKSTGDGFLVEFDSALNATECAVEAQRRLNERNSREPPPPILVRIGIHVGDVEELRGDIFGDAVNVASRVVRAAEPGGVLVSGHTAAVLRGKLPYSLQRLGGRRLKGVQDPVEVYRVILPWNGPPGTEADSPLPRIAVLPLANISPDPKDEYFADGLTEELISVLSQIRGLRVIARTSVTQYKGTNKPVSQIGGELGVGSVLEGSVRKAGDQLRICVQLVDSRTEEHRWAHSYDRRLENVFAIQAEVAERTADALKVELLRGEREAIRERPTPSLEAYESYLRGIQTFQQLTGASMERRDLQVVHYFEEAIRADPGFSAAYAQLANHLLAVSGITRPAREVFPRARELVARALELSPDSADARTAQGNLAFQADLDWPRAELEFQRALELNPSSANARFWYGFLLCTLQRFDECEKQYLGAIELDPLWLLARLNLTSSYAVRGAVEQAVAHAEATARSFEDDPSAQGMVAYTYALAGRAEDALRQLDRLGAASEPAGRLSRASVLLLLGHPEEAQSLLSDWEAGRIPVYVSWPQVAALYSACGDRHSALDLLERDCREGDRVLWAFYDSPHFNGLREEPRFVALLRAMNLPTTMPTPRSRPVALAA